MLKAVFFGDYSRSKPMKRAPCDVLNDHLSLALEHRFEEDLARNFAEDTVLLTSYGVFRGIEGLKQKVELLEQHLPDGRYEYKQILCEGDMGFLEWSGVGSGGERVLDGADSYLIRDGRIRVMTIHYTVIPPSAH
jgi:hypothetical protein